MAGYSRLAALMGKHHDLAIFRRFAVLNAKSLLFMQGELVHLEAELKMIALKNRDSDDPQKVDFEYSISALMGPHTSEDGHEHWAKILEIREKLKEYNEAVCRFSKICTLEKANKSDLRTLQDWLESCDGGDFFLRGYEADTWHKSNEEDLVSMTHRYQDKDIFSIWIDVYIIPFFHRVLGYRLKDREKLREEDSSLATTPLYHYPDSTTHAIIDIISTFLASLFPTVSAFILFFIHSPIARLSFIVASTVLFSIVLAVIARTRRVECFTSATTYVAVLVVFVGNFGNIGSPSMTT